MSAVVLAPFANERLRQWPTQRFRDLIDLITQHHGFPVVIVGTRQQRVAANDIVRGFSSQRVKNTCGALRWQDVVAAIDVAPYVVANNSGIVHLAAARCRWTLCVFAASHSPLEWMPRGPFVVTITRSLPCAPCSLGTNFCPNNVACMTDLPAAEVFWRFDNVLSSFS